MASDYTFIVFKFPVYTVLVLRKQEMHAGW
jgi:hypothetical protein